MTRFVARAAGGAVIGAAVFLAAAAAEARGAGGSSLPDCTNPEKQVAGGCRAPGSHAYERWDNGSPAYGSTATAPPRPPDYTGPQYFRGYNALYGFGR